MPVSQQERERRQDRPQAGPERFGPRRSLVGRETETVVLAGRLRDPSVRLLTLTGPAGVGKSRLAAEAAAGAADFFDEVRWVDLARKALPDRVPEGHVLLVLDGCDQPDVPPVAGIGELIASNDRLVVLATGQEPLHVYGERLLPVAPLPVPDTAAAAEPDVQEVQDVPSVALFIRRARDADPGFALTAENVAAVAEICALLEGLPLAVELAAGRLRLFPPHVLLARLRHRTTILAGGPVDAPERHRSLTALARWSCRQLDAEQRGHLEQLAVFERGFGLAMLVRVGAEDVLETLIDKNLLTVVDQELGEPRFAVPEPVRSFLLNELEQAGGTDAALDRHASEYQRLVTATEPRLAGTEQEKWLGVLAAESGNISAALRRLRARGEREAVAALVSACRQPWLVQGRLREGLDWCDGLAEDGPGDGGGTLPEPVRARLVDLSGTFTAALGDPDLAVRRHRRALALCKRLGDRRQGALVTARMGMALLLLGDPSGAQAALGPALATLESLGAAGPAAEAGTALAGALRVQGETRKGKELLDRALDAYRRIRDPRGLATALRESAAFAEDGEDLDAAGRALRESLRLYDSIGERTELPATLESFALLLLRASPGQQPRAVRLIAAADALRRSFGGRVPDERWGVLEEALAGLRERLHWTGFATAWAEGLRLAPGAAVAEALAAAVPAPHAEQESPAAQPLTPRQVQVAMLVSEGLTNRQIAGQLGISEWTVVNHVRQVMRRLNCTSRVQVAWSVGRWP
ncbi:helix-turn-helix transcriptional regulator [Streptomyces sp. RKAG337]|uniref:helix-turn-helix transcriptional regulator n=1 Tax=Streptomyces sp. RKAG337 TaxID=2893404 RepID=UPI002034A3A1|nr:LuxR C-terminal-related transcriptional regulator [Streptomyces sp. RKAG337]MCM2426180.1 LuxR C-terminal-related transcriptional regulator [Streptomyces sp. RKAG337]